MQGVGSNDEDDGEILLSLGLVYPLERVAAAADPSTGRCLKLGACHSSRFAIIVWFSS